VVRRNKGEEREIAQERIFRLMDLAAAAQRKGRADRANRYAELAWRVKTRYQIARSGLESSVCRACHAFLTPGVSARVRLTGGRRSVTCLACGATRRKVLRREPGSPTHERADEP